ncbi:hypothetical protein FPRO05_02132 [Fusarium proliferatum]|uniref:Protein NO VEIN C-terminal domain-containing protein n=1 Tax=Gibberella intermedia TaxID=948311 RepID=A0A365NA04_GIBIN|nr:hypothetical protein FPRO05_02132 [Fusarium proliferatum]
MASIQEAEQIVRRLTQQYGFLRKEMMDHIETLVAEYRREIDENWLAMENKLSYSIKILAKQIYGSGARFVFELLQNAEDNIFNKAHEAKALPFISFKIYPDKVIVDCNEDGFTEPDLEAICSVGQSTKSASHGYIGAKGIGFKSVFIAASRVHIQSGNFSFEFRHKKTDPGIGMVRPIWVNPVETIPSPLTRMTLYIHDQGDPDDLQHLRRIISMQFDDLQETCLLFLRKLEKISVEFYDENGELKRSKYFRKHKIDEYRVSLETTSGARGYETTQSQIYHITRQMATNLARSDNRELPDTEEAKNDSSKAEVVLAFPITDNSEPLMTQRNQDLFAFLPLRRSDYKFLIHSDFDTNANRQDIVTTSRRNLDLRGWIASAFFQAILQFCEHPTLCYSWPMFLPSSSDTSSDAFWSGLNHEIQSLMKKTPVLKSRNRIDLRLIGDVVILINDAQDAEGNPLFDDPHKDLYLSSNYSQKTVDILKGYGLGILGIQTFINLLETDLRSPDSSTPAFHDTQEFSIYTTETEVVAFAPSEMWSVDIDYIWASIEDLPAKKLCGVDYSLKLKEAWLPLKYLRHLVDRYMEDPKQFPFLKLEVSDTTELVVSKWHFLSEYFSVSKDDSMDFLLQILLYIQRSCPERPSDSQTQKVFDLYIAIYARLTVTTDRPDARRKITQFFNKQGVLDPNQNDPVWTTSPLCLWTAPPDMVMFHSLRASYRERMDNEKLGNIENLFKRTLQIPDASLDHLVSELTKLREEGCEEIPRIRAIYDYLHKANVPLPRLKAAFDASPLIYCETRHGEPGWYKTSDCLWSSETVIRGKAILDECWEAYENFFVGKLGVKLLTLQMVYDELRQSSGNNTEETKVAILSLNGLLQTEMTLLDPEPIRQAKVFPVRYPTGTVVLSSVSVDFAIGDRDKLKTMFRDKVALLDFEMEDVRRLRPLIEWLKLQDRYLSNSVEESTFILGDSESPISTPNRDLKRKAYHIARVASTFNSPRFEDDPLGLYEQLRTMRVVEVERISSVLKIFQNKQPFEIPVATANEHIENLTGELTIYVPKERRAQELCFGSVLPRKFAAWLMSSSKNPADGPIETDIVKVLTAVFASERFVLDDVLDDQGILTVSFDNQDEEDNSDEAEEPQTEDQEEEGQEPRLSGSRLETDDTSPEQLTPDRSSINASTPPYAGSSGISPEGSLPETLVETISQRSQMSYQPHSGRLHRSSQSDLFPVSPQPLHHSCEQAPSNPLSTITSPPEQQSSEDARYRSILDRVVDKARNAAFPSRGAFDMTHMRNALPGGDTNSYQSFDGLDIMGTFRSTNQLERDKKVGAAGELYVFELLSNLNLPNWNRTNWQKAWRGRETADLVYVDTEGHLTNTLIGCGYLGHDEWHGARPRYYIEVKTTTGPCSTAFYMSGKQYQLMQQIHHNEDHSEIYMVFRVFQLDSDEIGLCVYTDPEKLRQDGRLLFKGQAWSITPGPNMG